MGNAEERGKFVEQVGKACRIGARLRELGARPYGIVRIDSACSVTDWAQDPEANSRLIARTFSDACGVAEAYGERLAAEGEICWGGMHSWKQMIKLLELVDRPQTLGFQADMAHTLLYTMGYNAPEDALLPANYDWQDRSLLERALQRLTAELRPWTIDFHVAQNDATVRGSGSHDKTGRHCLATDPAGKLDIAHDAGYWLRDPKGQPTRAFTHICWDGCMFPNEVMHRAQTWNDILGAMVAVRDAHGWDDGDTDQADMTEIAEVVEVRVKSAAPQPIAPVRARAKTKPAARTKTKAKPARKMVKAKKVAKKSVRKTKTKMKAKAKSSKKSTTKSKPKSRGKKK
jgi:hypothetical protein